MRTLQIQHFVKYCTLKETQSAERKSDHRWPLAKAEIFFTAKLAVDLYGNLGSDGGEKVGFGDRFADDHLRRYRLVDADKLFDSIITVFSVV